MLEAAIMGSDRSTPGRFLIRRAILRLRRFNWRWRLAFTRRPPGWRMVEGVKYLDCSPEPGGFRVFRSRSASDYAWLRSRPRFGRGHHDLPIVGTALFGDARRERPVHRVTSK